MAHTFGISLAFATLSVKYFKEVNLKKGDAIAIGVSGSFPGLIIATLSAIKVLELKPLLIYSIGSSEYGTNIPEFTFVQMLDSLNKEEIFPYRLLAISLGGEGDWAEEMFCSDSSETMKRITQDSGATFIDLDNIGENI